MVYTHRYCVDKQGNEQNDEYYDEQQQTFPFVVLPYDQFARLQRRREPQKRRFRPSTTSTDRHHIHGEAYTSSLLI